MGEGRLRFAIVGAGVIAPFHARALGEIAGAELVAVVDEVEARAVERAREFGVEAATDLDAVLARPDVDAVTVSLPSGLHARIGVRAARAGKHVVVEKPIDVTLASADRLIAACREAGVTLGVISQHRWSAGAQELRRLLDEGRLGRPLLGDAVVKWYRSQEYYDSGRWRGTWEMDGGGCLINQGVHYVDLLQWLMGPVESVRGLTRTLAHARIDVEDVALALLTFRSGAVGLIETSTAVYPGLPERIEITGTEGTAILTEGELTFRRLKGEGERVLAKGGVKGGAADPAGIGHALHRAQLEDFVDAVRGGRAPLVGGEDARRPLEIILAVYESARTGREVSL